MAHFAGPILDRVDLFLAADGNAVRVASAPRAPPQRPSTVPRIRCATVRAAAPCVLAARGAPTSVPVARATRCWAPWLSIARAASRSPAVHGVIDTTSSTHVSERARMSALRPIHSQHLVVHLNAPKLLLIQSFTSYTYYYYYTYLDVNSHRNCVRRT